MDTTMVVAKAVGQFGLPAMGLVGVVVVALCVTTYFLGAHLVNKVASHASVIDLKSGVIRFRPPAK